MIRFDSALLEKAYPELDFRVGQDDNNNPFLAYGFWDGEYKELIWSFENIRWDNDNIKWVCEIYNYVDGMDDNKPLRAIQLEYFERFIHSVNDHIIKTEKLNDLDTNS